MVDGEFGWIVYKLDNGEKFNEDFKKLGFGVKFNRWNLLKVSVKLCILGLRN